MSDDAIRGEANEAWDVTWEASRAAQLRAIAKSTPAQRLEWLEQALRLALATGALPRS